MSIFEYDQEKHMRQEREAAWEDGHAAGIEEGRTAGIKEGRAAGIEEGRAAGFEVGRAAGVRETAKRLSAMEMPIEKIASVVEASVEEVQKWLDCTPKKNQL